MALSDKEKWDKKYIEKSELLKPREASRRVKDFAAETENGKALDLACGAGRNALYLAKLGYSVDAVDIAKAALAAIENKAEDEGVETLLKTDLADLDEYIPKKSEYDMVLMMNYLDRDLIERSKSALKKEGLFIVETYMLSDLNEKKGSNPDFLLQPGELKKIFAKGFEIIYYDEFENEAYEIYRMMKQAVVARKI